MDVTNEKHVETGVEEMVARCGAIDVLVSNAGIQIIHAIEQFPFDDWKRMISIHLDGAFLTTRACFRHMKERGRGGSIIYMGSVHSKRGFVSEIGLCDRQTWPHWAREDSRQRRWQIRNSRKCDLSGIRPHTARRQAKFLSKHGHWASAKKM